MSLVSPDYLPTNRPERAAWLTLFAINLPQFKTELGLSDALLEKVTYYAAVYNYMVGTVEPTAHRYWQNVSTLLDDVDTDSTPDGFAYPSYPAIPAPPAPPSGVLPPTTGIFNFVVKLVGTIKSNPKYREHIGTTLKIIAPETAETPADEAQPRFKVPVPLPGGAVSFTLVMGDYRLIVGRMRRNGATDWEKSYFIVNSKWTDNTPPAAPGHADAREYQFRYSDGNSEIGQWSEPVGVSTQP